MRSTFADGIPTYVRTSATQNARALDVDPGRAEVVRTGSLATVVAVGPMLTRTIEAAHGLDVSIIYATTVAPFDAATLRSAVSDGSTVIVVEPYYEGTTAAAMSPALGDRCVRMVSMGVPRRFLHHYGAPEEHDAALALDAGGIAGRLRSIVDDG